MTTFVNLHPFSLYHPVTLLMDIDFEVKYTFIIG